ncbi:retrovirus-related Pol polyprotein LINE-1 [Elysia marginata]|uniref:Retrovirus-related Pol polyprotein LINE-1 n=1 Tax=Elysia marginata TaxID=1093978 RepID=A0AAV4JXR2_9GAST|nr:retrovirus-related Pol polyprotein LINE-1 [Elysia marginata]
MFTKAFDRVRHDEIMKDLTQIKIDGKDLRVIKNINWEQTAAIRVEGETSTYQKIKRGVGQEKEEEDPLPTAVEINNALNKRLDNMMDDVTAATEVLDTWKSKVDILSQKVDELKSKKSELEGFNLGTDSLSLYQLKLKNKLKKVNVLLETAQAEQDILRDRIGRMENSLQHLVESQSDLERKYLLQKSQLNSLMQKLTAIQRLSGVECCVVDADILRITLQPKNMISSNGVSQHDDEDLEDCKLTADLKFALNEQGCLEISGVETLQNTEEIKELITHVKQDKDLPRFISGLRNTWLSSLPLNVEVAGLRKSHAIDFVQEDGILHLMINKRNVVCSLNVPKSYPCAKVFLTSVTGSELTTDKIPVSWFIRCVFIYKDVNRLDLI